MEQEMLEKDKCPLPLMQNSQGFAFIQWNILSLVATTVPSLVIIKQMVQKIVRGQC